MQIKNLDEIQIWWQSLQYSKRQRYALSIIALIVISISGAIFLWPEQDKNITVVPIHTQPPLIVIDVAGEVNSPGVYRLPPDARVLDAIEAAGKAKPSADLSILNLARPVKDGEQIYVDRKYSPAAKAKRAERSSSQSSTGPININRATSKDLDRLPGIGPVIAERIIQYRNLNGSFTSVEDLKKVNGIGGSKFEKIKERIRI